MKNLGFIDRFIRLGLALILLYWGLFGLNDMVLKYAWVLISLKLIMTAAFSYSPLYHLLGLCTDHPPHQH